MLGGGDWLDFTPLIAHGGGGLRLGAQGNHTYQNTLEALVQNYSLGHRVFEFDFQITRDKDVGAVHNGLVPDDANINMEMSSAEWKAYDEQFYYTTMLIEDILLEMLVNEDMFLVTDTKYVNTEIFEIICEHAIALDEKLLDRIVPQIYAIEMYDLLMDVYPFSSIIYTTYTSPDENEDIVDFIASKDNIHALTTPRVGRIDKGLLQMALEKDIPVFAHTINDTIEMSDFLSMAGVTGIYTDYITPAIYHDYLG